MNNVTQISSESNRDEAAGRWIAKVDRGITDAEKAELSQWLSRSDENRRAFLEMAELWDEMDAISILSEICPKSNVVEKDRQPYKWAIAASLLVAVASSLVFVSSDSLFDSRPDANAEIASLPANIFATEVGEQATFELPDGSTLALNTNSYVSINFTDANRFVVLERGEIHVNVAHESRPLSVLVGGQVIQALGTEFNVEITDDQSIELVVTEGLVVVGILDAATTDLEADRAVELPPTSTLVAGGEEAVIRQVEQTLQKIETEEIKTEEITVKLSWRNGNIIFTGETLEEAVKEVERYTEVKFVFLDEDSKQEEISGFYKAGDVDSLLAVLRREFKISYQWVGDDRVELAAIADSD